MNSTLTIVRGLSRAFVSRGSATLVLTVPKPIALRVLSGTLWRSHTFWPEPAILRHDRLRVHDENAPVSIDRWRRGSKAITDILLGTIA
jgi:hypothetical protein